MICLFYSCFSKGRLGTTVLKVLINRGFTSILVPISIHQHGPCLNAPFASYELLNWASVATGPSLLTTYEIQVLLESCFGYMSKTHVIECCRKMSPEKAYNIEAIPEYFL